MKGRGLNILAIASSYMGAIIGAGFASGQEILQFFVQFGPTGLKGMAIAGILFAFLGGFTLMYNHAHKLNSYGEFLFMVLGKKLGLLSDVWITLLLFSGLVIMLAGSMATLEQQFHIIPGFGLLITLLIVFTAVLAGEKGVLIFNSLLIPLLIIITILVSVMAVGQGSLADHWNVTPKIAYGNWFLAALLYVSYNMLTGAVFLASLKISSAEEALGGFLGGIGLGLLIFLVGLALLINYSQIASQNIPMLYLAQGAQRPLDLFYALVIWFAMITTAVTNVFSLTNRIVSVSSFPRLGVILFLLFFASVFTPLGFEQLIAILYPFFGYLGFVLLGGMLLAYGKLLGNLLSKKTT